MSEGLWTIDRDAAVIVEDCIHRWHSPRLENAHILVVSKPKCSKKAGKQVWASIKAASDLEQVLYGHDVDYVIVVGRDVWERLPASAKTALIDHELCHAAGQDLDTGKWTLDGHDVEEFIEVLERHGAWRESICRLVEVARVIELPQLTLEDAMRATAADEQAEREARQAEADDERATVANATVQFGDGPAVPLEDVQRAVDNLKA